MFFKSNRLEMEKHSTKYRLSALDELGIKGLERMPSNFNIFKPLLNVIPLTIETKKKIEARQSTFLGSAESTDSAVKIKQFQILSSKHLDLEMTPSEVAMIVLVIEQK